jgi:hypothetical protein
MKKFLAFATAALVIVGFTMEAASARHHHRSYRMGHGMVMGSSMTGGNAALSGNNGNSGSGSNSLGHIKGGNNGGGK